MFYHNVAAKIATNRIGIEVHDGSRKTGKNVILRDLFTVSVNGFYVDAAMEPISIVTYTAVSSGSNIAGDGRLYIGC